MNKSIFKSCHKDGFTEEEVYGAYKIFFGTLVSDSRLCLMNCLRSGKKNVSQLKQLLKMEQTAVSHDLARLKQCGFVNVSVKGKFRYYALNEKTIKPLMSLIDQHMSQYCIHILRKQKGEEA